MYINRAIRAILLSFLIVLGSITFLSIPGKGQNYILQNTTL